MKLIIHATSASFFLSLIADQLELSNWDTLDVDLMFCHCPTILSPLAKDEDMRYLISQLAGSKESFLTLTSCISFAEESGHNCIN